MHHTSEPILASWRISDVLQRYPHLLDVLADLTPALGKLRNPIVRKVQSRLVTVEQVAGIAGIDPRQLVRTLNHHAGVTPPAETIDPATSPASPVPDWYGRTPVSRDLDVRPMLARGEEPFSVITTAARAIPIGGVLRLIVGFEPLPLYDAMAKQGFSHHGERRADAWQVEFRRDRAIGSGLPSTHTTSTVDWEAPIAADVTIDVSELVPPEPMVKILRALEDLPPGNLLLVHHVRRPIHLYDRLDEMGYPHETRDFAAGNVEILISKPLGASASS